VPFGRAGDRNEGDGSTTRFANIDAVGSSDGVIKRSLSSQSTSREREGEVVKLSLKNSSRDFDGQNGELSLKTQKLKIKILEKDYQKRRFTRSMMSYMGKSSSLTYTLYLPRMGTHIRT
jgi:hypothetical protein